MSDCSVNYNLFWHKHQRKFNIWLYMALSHDFLLSDTYAAELRKLNELPHMGCISHQCLFSSPCYSACLPHCHNAALQVIYKKFSIPCPFEEFGNSSINATLEEDCEGKFITINQQVRAINDFPSWLKVKKKCLKVAKIQAHRNY